jgi:kumamolisin
MQSNQPSSRRVALAGSERSFPQQASDKGPVDPDQKAQVTILLRSRASDADMDRILQQASAQPVGSRQYLSREQLGELRGAEGNDVARVEQFATTHHLTVTHVDQAARTISVEGSLKDLEQAFGVELRKYEQAGHTFRARSGAIQLPYEIAPAIDGVLGLDTRPAADTRSASK